MTSTPTAPRGRSTVVPRRPGTVPPAPGGSSVPGSPAGPASPGASATAAKGRAAVRSRLSRTPGRLRLFIALAVLASLVVGVCGVLLTTLTSAATSGVVARVDSILTLQDARASLVAANGTASNAFLVGGLEPVAQREAYDAFLATGTQDVAVIAASDADPANTLGPVAASLTTYSGLIEQARANNRQGFPVGAAYLDTASVLLADEVLPPIDAAIVTNADNAAAGLNSVGAIRALLWVVVLVLVVLVAIQVWLARRMRRTINPAMLIGSLVVLVAWFACVLATDSGHSSLRDTREGSYAATLATSQALSLAGEARTAESFGLIQRGSGQAYEETFDEAIEAAFAQLDRRAVTTSTVENALTAWRDAHDEIRALDDAGDWDGAVALAVSTEPGSPSALYQTFVDEASASVDSLSNETREGFRSATPAVTVTGWTLVAAGLACALLSWRGINKRLEEYR